MDYRSNYHDYLKSSEWKRRRLEKLTWEEQCECCWKKAEEVHHISYERIGKERGNDIKSVCKSCHEKCHNDKKWKIKNDEISLNKRFCEVQDIYQSLTKDDDGWECNTLMVKNEGYKIVG
jgi:hypothetical protein